VAVAVVSVRVVSVAVSTHEPVSVNVSAVKVATPATALALAVPPRVQVDEIVTISVAPVPVASTLPKASSTETAKDVSAVPVVVTEAGGFTVKTTCVAAPAVTTVAGVLVAVVSALVESVAISVHEPAESIVAALNVATPAKAAAERVPPSLQADVSDTVSVAPMPDVMTTPLLSSTETAKVVRAVPAAAVAGGSGVKATRVGVVVATEIAALTMAGNEPSVESVAVSVQLVPVVMSTVVKVATPAAATSLSVPPNAHPAVAVEMTIVSVAPAPEVLTFPDASSTETLNDVRATLNVAFVGGTVV